MSTTALSTPGESWWVYALRSVRTGLGTDRFQAALRLFAAVAAVAVAFHYTLLTLLRSLGLQTPLAYLGLVPFIALGIAALRVRPSDTDPGVHDRTIDFIVGIPLMVASLLVLFVLPVQRSTTFWPWRLDVLGLPLFAAGAVALLLGVRTLGRLKAPIAFLVLAWPWPYKALLSSALDGFTNATIAGLRQAVEIVPVARPILEGDGSRFAVSHGGSEFNLSVAAACAGVNGVVGFFIVGTAFLLLVKGPRLAKLTWLALGLGVIWVLNLVRIMVLFAAGQRWGQGVAIDGLHPFIGLVTFSLGVVLMIAVLRFFRLSIPVHSRAASTTLSSSLRRAVPRPGPAIAVVAVFSLVLGMANHSLRANELTASDLGEPRLIAFSEQPAQLEGWNFYKSDEYDHGKPYFGKDSTWSRYDYSDLGGGRVIADVINSGSLRAFEEYSVEACYGFHGYDILSTQTVDLGGGVIGQVLTFHDPKAGDGWTTLNWIWPVKDGEDSRFERVTLFTKGTGTVESASPAPVRELGSSIDNVLRQDPAGDRLGDDVAAAEAFLKDLGAAIVTSQASAAAAAASAD